MSCLVVVVAVAVVVVVIVVVIVIVIVFIVIVVIVWWWLSLLSTFLDLSGASGVPSTNGSIRAQDSKTCCSFVSSAVGQQQQLQQ